MKVVVTDYNYVTFAEERAVLDKAGHELVLLQCRSSEEVIRKAADADALLVQYAQITEPVLAALEQCKVIVRYGIGVDTVDLEAAKKHSTPICNVPDYGINEVADHAASMIISQARQLTSFDSAIRQGEWPATPQSALLSFEDMCLAVMGAGKIGRALIARMQAFGFECAAYDPFVSEEALNEIGVRKLELDEVFATADVISLHLPLNADTHHLVDENRLKSMKETAILVNTSRGGLIDTHALAKALDTDEIAFAGIDVFEQEPMEEDHPLRTCKNAMLTPHMAYYSDASVKRLKRYAAEEVARALAGEPLRCPVA
jgi:D-3-phosphoglycerate dehydrogenase